MPIIIDKRSGQRVPVMEDQPWTILDTLSRGLLRMTLLNGKSYYATKESIVGFEVWTKADFDAEVERQKKAEQEKAEAAEKRKKDAETLAKRRLEEAEARQAEAKAEEAARAEARRPINRIKRLFGTGKP